MRYFSLILLCFLILSGCKSQMDSGNRIIIHDMLERKVPVPENVGRVIGVGAGALRLLSYLDAADMVAGVEDIEHKNDNPYNLANPVYKELPVIGPRHGGDAELITVANPDVIFITYATVGDVEKLQRQTGIPVVALDYGDLTTNKNRFYKSLRLIAKIIDKTPRADTLIANIEMLIGDLGQRTKETSTNTDFTVYAGGISYRGAHGITSTIPEYAPFEFIHIKNLAHNLNSVNNNVQIDKEQLVQWDPDKIFVDFAGLSIVLEELNEDVLKKTLSAIKNNDVYVLLPCNWYTTNFETLFVNAYYSGKVLFPDQFSDISMEKKADEIYNLFLSTKGLYGSVKEHIGEPGKIDFF